jgi:hypothetical protein
LQRLLFDDWLEAVSYHGGADEPAKTTIVHVILGIGCKLEEIPLTSALDETFATSRSYVQSALGQKGTLIEAPATVLKVQVRNESLILNAERPFADTMHRHFFLWYVTI